MTEQKPLLTPQSKAADHEDYIGPHGGVIAFQKGAMELGRNGWTTEEILTILINHLSGFQAGPFKCVENENVIALLKDARFWVQLRAHLRTQAGLKGRDGAHESHIPAEPIQRYFAWEHLPEHLRFISQRFGVLARTLEATLPRSPERSVALRKLLEGKDAAVRAGIDACAEVGGPEFKQEFPTDGAKAGPC
jgi:hypothetical protein